MSAEIINAGRTLAEVTQEIKIVSAQTVQSFCRLGKLLYEAKAQVGHGKWGEYLEKEISYSHSTANNFMRLYDEYGEFGPKSQTIGNLGYSKAIALLGVPAEERESFAAEHKAENLSVAQLKKEIARYKGRAEVAEQDVARLQQGLAKEQESVDTTKQLLQLATEENGALKQRLAGIDADYKTQLDVVDKENDELRAQLEAAQNAPAKISAEQAEKLRAEGRRAAEKDIREEYALVLAEAGEEADELRRQLEAERAKAAAAPSALNDPDVAAFKLLVEQLVETSNKALGYYKKVAARSPENGLKMANAFRSYAAQLNPKIDAMLK